MTELLLHSAHYQKLVKDIIPQATRFVWIVTADIKDMYVEAPGGRYEPFLRVLAELIDSSVTIRLIHAKEPGPRFREDFDRFPSLISDNFERVLCPRVHMKTIIVDGKWAYVGSANLTGAGLGPKNEHRRNFEAGILTDDTSIIQTLMDDIDELYLGNRCRQCQRRDVCPDPIQ
ncbi:MAG: phosphatidylserine synthase [Verrucomicrobiaceae bacterium]|nr:phosphatidylserine synthase [Verrucomicrobiaceae bacterium]